MSLINRERNEQALAAAGEVLRSRSLTQLAFARFLRNRVAVGATLVVATLVLMAIFAPVFEMLTGYQMDFQDRNFYSGKAPDWNAKHYFGTDQNGRDIFVRTIFGMRISMLVALVAASVALVIG
jgi:oligopeptide transport system permease protein